MTVTLKFIQPKDSSYQKLSIPFKYIEHQEKVKLWHIIHDLVIGAEFNRGENRFWKIWFGRTFSSGEQIYKKKPWHFLKF